jgi:hypothetical protein
LPRPMNAILDMGLPDVCKEALKRGSSANRQKLSSRGRA